MLILILAFIFIIIFIVVIVKAVKTANNLSKSSDNTNTSSDNRIDVDLSKILVFDTETTGLSPKTDEILEIAIINGMGDVLFNHRIKPTHTTSWKDAEAVNGISYDDVKDCKTISEYKEELQTLFNNAQIIVGYNVMFDLRFIHASNIRTHAEHLIDVMKDYSIENHLNRRVKLTEAANHYGYTFTPHGALEDAKATLHVFKKLQGLE